MRHMPEARKARAVLLRLYAVQMAAGVLSKASQKGERQMTNYITTVNVKVTNNSGGNMGNMSSGTPFTCEGWVKDGRLNIASNRWIPVGTYKVVIVIEPTGRTVINIRTSTDGGQSFDVGKFYEEI